MGKHKVVIIKPGYSEFLEGHNNSRKTSLGDVLRITPLLHLYEQDHVSFVTDIDAFPLLKNNPFIDRLIPYDLTTALQLESEEFDTLINLEKVPGICALADKVKAWRRFGFRFNSRSGEAEAYDQASGVLTVSADPIQKKNNKKTSQELLFSMVGEKWNGEEYILGYDAKTTEKYDVGLNTLVGPKWPTKKWPNENWNKLEKMLEKEGLSTTRQDKQPKNVLTNIEDYADWINSSRLIVTNDSLGLHLGIALKKQVLGLFGPTPSAEVYFYGKGEAIYSLERECIPCFKETCDIESKCMTDITPELVFNKIKEYKQK